QGDVSRFPLLGEGEKYFGGAKPDFPVDIVAVGHYLLSRPSGAALDLDRAISRGGLVRGGAVLAPSDLLLARLAEWGVLRGWVGRVFLLPDPRVRGARDDAAVAPRMLAVVGMGATGQFGPGEMTLLLRSLIWTAEQLGARPLALPLMGVRRG